jgi:hypothetical protein
MMTITHCVSHAAVPQILIIIAIDFFIICHQRNLDSNSAFGQQALQFGLWHFDVVVVKPQVPQRRQFRNGR